MSSIKIQRTSEFNNRIREYKIYIDGQLIGKIGNGETKYFETTTGLHTLNVKTDWCSSPDITFNINNIETKNFKVGEVKIVSSIMPVTLGVIFLHIALSRLVDFNYTILILIPTFLLLVYFLTIGRNNYLTINEIK